MKLNRVRIILVEPAGPLNVGSVARVMKNMGLEELWLVNPKCDRKSEAAQLMAVHGGDVLESAKEAATLPEALVGCQRAIATTSRKRDIPIKQDPPRIGIPWLLEEGVTSALIFGPEDRGLNNIELNYAQRFISIPANPKYPSLNLAQAVAICCYELYQFTMSKEDGIGERPEGRRETEGSLEEAAIGNQQPLPSLTAPTTENTLPPLPIPHSSFPISPTSETASLDVLEAYVQHLEAVLLKIGYLYPHTANSRIEKLRRILHRATPTPEEVKMLRGILRQTEWALQFLPRSLIDGK
ncbi:MAG TPA: RNA methyltransferase [Cyanobacteria bacterium UBA11149]|nr:RNA methyltransferase [Cyanobacteria bacterium UBA11367]HBE59119.1 RNA methyltransferase [Cyanobacteria bacterium UBA11366]HBK64993.1 RNA methyltransferase [Cyanobacteria bacterium UBA11166]HBR76981.1 RNA methyltransferase [Cyanobacteria bacterium UBA11159]HBS69214.1 RNA methyltransferase [Cyanobacteria bacterium UBA11153]HBW90820.1 RNA methyltransferase [Cyanobacteria bacterium UBA11149]HCA94084.1 RNA methyltransferase [Cyanobacteria bacterium UBA9226]